MEVGQPRDPDEVSKRKKAGRLRQVAIIFIVVVAADILILGWVVPWVDENYSGAYGSATLRGSVGYVITFLTFFVNLLIIIGLVAYYHDQLSYPSDRWK